MEKMTVLILNPSYKIPFGRKYEKYYIRSGSRWPHSGVKLKGSIPHYLPFPFFLAYAAALLRNTGFNVYVLDAVALDITYEELLKQIKNINPDVIFYEITTVTYNFDVQLAKDLKAIFPKSILVAGGTHATIFAQNILKSQLAIDYIVKGEYEFTLRDLVLFISKYLVSIPKGVVFRDKNKIVDTGNASLIDLNVLPFPARDIFPSNDYSNPAVYWDGFCQNYPAIQMHTSRGCPYHCYFCLWNKVLYNYGKFRTFASQRIVEEMRTIKFQYHAKEIYFDDDNFTANKNHVRSLCREIKRSGLKIKWSCMADAINLEEDVLAEMAKSGCIGIKFGVESASPRIIKTIGKPVKIDKVSKLVSLCQRYRIKTHATFMLGLLGEKKEDIKRTIRFAQALDVDSLQISIATPFPGTEFYNIVKEKGFLRSEDWRLFDGKVSEIVSYPYLDWKDVERLRRGGLLRWALGKLMHPQKAWRWLRIVLGTFRGVGIRLFTEKLLLLAIDELKNK